MNGRSSTCQTERPARFGRPLRSSNNGYGAWESPAGRAAPAHYCALLFSSNEALLYCDRVLGFRDRPALVTRQNSGDGVGFRDARTGVYIAAELRVELAVIVATDCDRPRQHATSASPRPRP